MPKSQDSEIINNFNYKNITISGLPGAGSTTLLSLLKEDEDLKFAGFSGFNGGEFMRVYAKEKGLFKEKGGLHHSANDYEDDFDRQVDMGIRSKLQNESGWIIESWLSGFLAQQVPSTLKVLMICSDDAVRIDRIVNRDGVSPADAIAHTTERYEGNFAKWKRMYSSQWREWVVIPGTLGVAEPIDFWNQKLYDIVIDTYSTNRQETLQIVLDAIKK